MFSGIIETTGRVAALRTPGPDAARLVIDAAGLFTELALGASVAVNGVCLTLVARSPATGEFDIVPETLRRTSLGGLRPGSRVNLERSLRLGDRIDGHLVQGHVDAAGAVQRIDRSGGEWKLWVECAPALTPFIVPKGSIALDGVSLTLVDAVDGLFSVVLIPATLERTTLGERQPGDALNIETDMLARVAVRHVDALLAGRAGAAARGPSAGLTVERLQASGFLP